MDRDADARARAAARHALFGDDPVSSADERDDADRADQADRADPDAERRRYEAERPPHHDR